MGKVTLKKIKQNPQITAYINKADEHLRSMGFTEHSFRHANLVADIAKNILEKLDYPERIMELAAIAGYLHDIGNVVNRERHGHISATLVSQILTNMDVDYEEIATIIGAIGNHDEGTGEPVSPVAAALIISDKSDVHWTRVRNEDYATFDIHDRVNYAAKQSFIEVDPEGEKITLELEIDKEISTVMEYFEIFLTRMIMCRRAAETLSCDFHLIINEVELL
ncbi:HD domain-containing protein [Selenihalanaerobacter shriftii]|uniref:Metal dependent phosphohydrolase n=1 Tax=Selenihalanaerobacter shriftii TaxID=142842 RepID=A0A1T4MZM4_9FIRM|nr:HD domain-containing protein [Selenihalanaerobacter shriftii]SJZ72306.1 metal dependent phosphohydrolase [Selenihalanaerobacter shriftii]